MATVQMEDALCTKCFGVGNIEVKPDQLGMLRRPELEQAQHRSYGVRVYEHGDGSLEAFQRPYRMRVLCPKCRPDAYRRRG